MSPSVELAPPRVAETVPIVNETGLVMWTIPWQVRPPQDTLTVIVKACFQIDPGKPCVLLPETDPPMGDLPGEKPDDAIVYASDFVYFKPRADVTLSGTAKSKGERPTRTMTVSMQFGKTISRKLLVLGDRKWSFSGATQPEPFTEMPLVWEKAFGGAGFDGNPKGAGYGGRSGDLLPNLEDPTNLVKGPKDSPTPMCFAPVCAAWKSRAALVGTYDKRWQKTRWPYFPEDFEYSYFNAAPMGQQVPYLRGDEEFRLGGFDPESDEITGSLPGLRPRVFAQYTREAGEGFVEVLLNLDTVHFDMDAKKVTCLWRGILEVRDEDAPELSQFFVHVDKPDEAALTEANAREAYADVLRKRLETDEEEPPADEESPPPPEWATANPALLQAVAETQQRADQAAATQAATPLPAISTEEVMQRVQRRESLAGMDLSHCDLSLAELSGVDFAGAILHGAKLSGARLIRSRLPQADLSKVVANGTDFSECDLSEADFTGADLTGAVFRHAYMPSANFEQSNLSGVIARECNAAEALFTDATVVGTEFDGSILTKAEFTGCKLDRTSFVSATLSDAKVYDSNGHDVRFDDATMEDFRGDGATLKSSTFRRAKAKGSSWSYAKLDKAVFDGAVLEGSLFTRTSLEGASLSVVEAKEASFRRARLVGARCMRSNFMKCNFERADMTRADMRESNLFQSEFRKTVHQNTDFTSAIIAGTRLAETE